MTTLAPPSRPTWRLDDTLAREVAAAAGVHLGDPAGELVAAMHRWIPSGSTSKHEAVTAGRLPPGDAPGEIVESILSGSTHSWTCWASATVTAALLTAAGHDTEVAAELRFGPGTQPWDAHAVVVVDGATVADPCLGPDVPVPFGGARDGDSAIAELGGHPAGWLHTVELPGYSRCQYRTLARYLGAMEVRSFLAVSVTHSGVRADRLDLRCPVPGGVMAVRHHTDSTSSSTRWTRQGVAWAETSSSTGSFEDLVRAALDARAVPEPRACPVTAAS